MARLTQTYDQKITQMSDEERAIYFQNQALDAAKRISSSYIDLAEAIYYLKNELFRKFGVPTFSVYCETVLDMKQGKAYALARVWEVAVGYNLSKERLDAMGWAKADMLARHITSENADDIMEWAESMTLKEFTAKFKGAGRGDGSIVKFVLTFDMSLPYSAVMSEAIEQAKRVFKSDDPAFVVAALASEWMNMSGHTSEQIDAQTYLRFLERSYGGHFTYSAPEGTVKDVLAEQEFEDLNIEDPLSEEDLKTLTAEA